MCVSHQALYKLYKVLIYQASLHDLHESYIVFFQTLTDVNRIKKFMTKKFITTEIASVNRFCGNYMF